MSKPKLPSLRDVTTIVINRVAVWEYVTPPLPEEDEIAGDDYWQKIAGGPGFDANANLPCHFRTYPEMRTKVNIILSRKHRVPLLSNRIVEIFREETAYRWWISGTTLNIVRRLYGKELLAADMERIARTGKYVPWDEAKKELGLGNGDE